ncbi:hypothetical protein BGZ60DRAFT_434790 [Tricladium varicosporioides]|nr:hypothetical protein BGZ60DRAFT_434790 [Hymenoscyphus varicosporioides]
MSRSPRMGEKRRGTGGDFGGTPGKYRKTSGAPFGYDSYHPENIDTPFSGGRNSSPTRSASFNPPKGPGGSGFHFTSDRVKPHGIPNYDRERGRERSRERKRVRGRERDWDSDRDNHRSRSRSPHRNPPRSFPNHGRRHSDDRRSSLSHMSSMGPPSERSNLPPAIAQKGSSINDSAQLANPSNQAPNVDGPPDRQQAELGQGIPPVALDPKVAMALATSLGDMFLKLMEKSTEAALSKSRMTTAETEYKKKKQEFLQGKASNTHAKYPLSEQSQRDAMDHANKQRSILSRKYKDLQESLNTTANEYASSIVPKLVEAIGGSKENHELEDVKEQFSNLDMRCAGLQKQLEEQKNLFDTEKRLRQKLEQDTIPLLQTKLQKFEAELTSIKAEQDLKAKTQSVVATDVATIKRDIVSAQTEVSLLKTKVPADLNQKLDIYAAQSQDIVKLEAELSAYKTKQNSYFEKTTEDTKSLISGLEGRLTDTERKLKQTSSHMITLTEDQTTTLTSYKADNAKWQNGVMKKLQALEQSPSPWQQLTKEDLAKLKEGILLLEPSNPTGHQETESLQSLSTKIAQLKDGLEDNQITSNASYDALSETVEVLIARVDAIADRVDGQEKVMSGLRSSYSTVSELTSKVDDLRKAQSHNRKSATPGLSPDTESQSLAAVSKIPDVQKLLDQITQLQSSLERVDKQHANSIANIENRYNKINTLELYNAIAGSVISDIIGPFEQRLEAVRAPFVVLQSRFEKLANERNSLGPDLEKRLQELERVRSPSHDEGRMQKLEMEHHRLKELLQKFEDTSTKFHTQVTEGHAFLEKIPNPEKTRQLRGEIDLAVFKLDTIAELVRQLQETQANLKSEIDKITSDNYNYNNQVTSHLAEVFMKFEEIGQPEPLKPKNRRSVESSGINGTNKNFDHKSSSSNGAPHKIASKQGNTSFKSFNIDSDADDGDYEARPEAPSGDEDDE